MIPEREKDPDWKPGERSNSGTHNRSRCCSSTKSEAPKLGPSPESCPKQNGEPPHNPLSAASPAAHSGLVSLVLLVCSRCVSRSRPTEVHRRKAQRGRLRVRLRLRQLVREREGQQGELGQLEQHQQRGGRPGRWRSHTPLHYLIKKK